MDKFTLLDSTKTLHGSSFLWGAHHPHCSRHDNHLIWIANHPLCLGCTCMYVGITIGIPIALFVNWSGFSLITWVFFHWLLLFPTILQVKIQYKPFKIVSRLLLGMCISLYWVSGIFLLPTPFNPWLFRMTVVFVFFVFHRSIKWVRNRYTESPCDNCPLGMYPTCEWNLPRLLAENEGDEVLLTALTSDQIQNLVVK